MKPMEFQLFFNCFFKPKFIQNDTEINPKIPSKNIKRSIKFCIRFDSHFQCILESFSNLPNPDFRALACTRCNFTHFGDVDKSIKTFRKMLPNDLQKASQNYRKSNQKSIED